MKTPKDYAKELSANPYTFPGGYPLCAITDDGGVLCKNCCRDELDTISESIEGDGWHIIALEINYEDPGLTCDHCGNLIESAYD